MLSEIYRTAQEHEEWECSQASSDEKEIFQRIWCFRSMFDDLTLKNEAIKSSIYEECSVPDIIRYILDNVIVRVGTFRYSNAQAQYVRKTHTINIAQEYIKDDHCLLHEMLHVFDEAYDFISGLRDAVRWRLYYSLQDKINGLDKAILEFTKLKSLVGINRCLENPNVIQQRHDTLFLLKSFDLDLKMGYELGTVLGYGYTEIFKDLA